MVSPPYAQANRPEGTWHQTAWEVQQTESGLEIIASQSLFGWLSAGWLPIGSFISSYVPIALLHIVWLPIGWLQGCGCSVQHTRENVTPGLQNFVSGSKHCDLSGTLGRVMAGSEQSRTG